MKLMVPADQADLPAVGGVGSPAADGHSRRAVDVMQGEPMRYEEDCRVEWVAWFLSPTTRDESELGSALRSVPAQPSVWQSVELSLRLALQDLEARLQPPRDEFRPPTYRRYTEKDLRDWSILALKQRLLFDEAARRRRAACTSDATAQA
jgi:hypothetical protein